MLGDTFGFPLQHESSFCLPLSLDIVRRLQQEKQAKPVPKQRGGSAGVKLTPW